MPIKIQSGFSTLIVVILMVVLAAAVLAGIYYFSQVYQKNVKAPNLSVTSSQTSTEIDGGYEAYLRLPNTQDTAERTTLVYLVTDLELFDEFLNVLVSQDVKRLQELMTQGKVLTVSHGSKVLVMDKSANKLLVRVLQGVKDFDKDKIGKEGWVLEGWVAK